MCIPDSVRSAIAALILCVGSSASATYTIDVRQVGPDVVVTGSGSLDTTGAIFEGGGVSCSEKNGFVGSAALCVGSGATSMSGNVLTPGLGTLASTETIATSSTGLAVYVGETELYLPASYNSKSPIANSSTFSSQTLESMGLPIGTTKTLSLPSGDTIVINIGLPLPNPSATTAVPTLREFGLSALISIVAILGLRAAKHRAQK